MNAPPSPSSPPGDAVRTVQNIVAHLRGKKWAIANEVGEVKDDPIPYLAADMIDALADALRPFANLWPSLVDNPHNADNYVVGGTDLSVGDIRRARAALAALAADGRALAATSARADEAEAVIADKTALIEKHGNTIMRMEAKITALTTLLREARRSRATDYAEADHPGWARRVDAAISPSQPPEKT